MNDSPRPASAVRAGLRRFFRWLQHPLSTELSSRRELFADLQRQASQIQTLEELLVRFPERLCESFSLCDFHVFVVQQGRDGHVEYCLDEGSAPVCIAGSSAVVARMKRERRPSLFRADAPDAWQLLATPAELALLETLGTQMLLPLAGRTRLAGFVALARRGGKSFTGAELRFFRDLGPRLGRGLETALLLKTLSHEAVERDRHRRELLLAREVQEHLLPAVLPTVEGLELASFYSSAAEVGGDYFDAFVTPAGDLCVVIADVSGKGVPAALVMAALRASLHALMLEATVDLATLASRLNELLYTSSTSNRYATLFVALYHPAEGTLEFCNAGHNAPALRTAEGSIKRLEDGGSVLGLLPGGAFQTSIVPFTPGSTLVLYTDGITEAPNSEGSEWSEERLHEALHRATAVGAAGLLHELQAKLNDFAKGTPPTDDQTMLVLSRL